MTCFVPTNPAETWAAIGAIGALVAAVATVAVAALAVRISRLQLKLESTPIIVLSRRNGTTSIENVGRGLALTITACGSDGDIKDEHESLRPGEKRTVRITPSITVSNAVYYQGPTGQWFRSKVTGRSLMGDDKQYPVDTEFKAIRRGVLPKTVKLRMRRHARSAYEHLQQISSFVTLEGWTNRVTVRVRRVRRVVERRYYAIGEKRGRREYESYVLQADRTTHYPLEVRRSWEFDLQGIANCWHSTGLDVDHYGCFVQSNGALVCEVGVNYVGEGRVNGLVVISPRSRASMLQLPQSARSDIAWEKLSNYLCGRMPKESFVVIV